MTQNDRHTIVSRANLIAIVALVVALLGNIVAGFFQDFFEVGPLRPWLAGVLFVTMVIWGIWLAQNELLFPPRVVKLLPVLFWSLVGITSLLGGVETGRSLLQFLSPVPEVTAEPPERYCPGVAGQSCVLVATFFPADEDAQRFQVAMLTQLSQRLEADPTSQITVVPIDTIIQTWGEARLLAQEQNALMVIWGLVDTKQGNNESHVTVHFEVTDQLGVGADANVRPYRVQPLFYNPLGGGCTDCLEIVALQQAATVAQTAVGLAYYAQDRPKEAGEEFLSALACAGALTDQKLLGLTTLDCTPTATPTEWNPALLTYYAGRALSQQGDFRHAETLLQQALVQNPNDLAVRVGLAALYQRWLRNPQAEPALAQLKAAQTFGTELPRKTPSELQPVVNFNLGVVNELLGDYAAALQHFHIASQTLPHSYAAFIAATRVHKAMGNQRDAEDLLTQAVVLEPDQPWAYLEQAVINQDRFWFPQRTTNAILHEVTARFPSVPAVYLTQAEICIAWGHFACAEAAYAQAETLRPSDGYLHLLLADFYRVTNPPHAHQSWSTAIQHYQRATTQLRPNDPWAHEGLGYALFNQKRYAESLAAYDRAIELVYLASLPQLCQTRRVVAEAGGFATPKLENSRCNYDKL